MKVIYKIAKFELSTMFYSPIAWLVLILFMVQSAVSYTITFDILQIFESLEKKFTNGVTWTLLVDKYYGFFPRVLEKAFLFTPLLTMGLISKEISSGSIKLLLSSPITSIQLVLGKYLSMVIFALIMSIALLVISLAIGFSVQEADYGLLLSAILGFFLLIITYCAIGLFISSLTSYQEVAAIATFAILILFTYIDELGQGIPVLQDITFWLKIDNGALNLIRGLVKTSDLFYFLIIATLFLVFTITKIESGRKIIPIRIRWARYTTLFVMAMALAYVSSRPSLIGYWDVTNTKHQTLMPNSIAIAEKIDGPIKMTNYVNILDIPSIWYATPRYQNHNKSIFEKYKRYLPQMEHEYVYFYDTIVNGRREIFQQNPKLSIGEIAEKEIKALKMENIKVLTPQQIKQRIDLSGEDNQFVKELAYNGKTAILRMFDDGYQHPFEPEVSAALKRLVVEKPPAIGFVMGHGERSYHGNTDKDFNMAMVVPTYRDAIIQHGFDFQDIDLASQGIPSGTSILVIADPISPYTEAELAKIKEYLDQGGNAIILGDPENMESLQPLVQHLGIEFINGVLQQQSDDFAPDFILADFAQEAIIVSNNSKEFIDTKKKVSMPSAMPLKNNGTAGFTVNPYLEVFSGNTQLQRDSLNMGPIAAPVALALSRTKNNKEQRIFVVGDADFLSNMEITRDLNDSTCNNKIVEQIFGWLTHNEFPVDVDRPKQPDSRLKIGNAGFKINKIVLIGVLPIIILLMGAAIIIKRKKA